MASQSFGVINCSARSTLSPDADATTPAAPPLALVGDSASRGAAVGALGGESDEERAFEAIFHAYYDPLCRFAFGYVGSPHVAEELVQDVFTRFWAQRDRTLVGDYVRAYLYAATRNACVNHAARQRVVARWEGERGMLDVGDRPLGMGERSVPASLRLEGEELEAGLARVIAGLPERCRQTFALRRRDGLTPPEIARAMGVSVKCVERQLTKALAALREEIARRH